MSTRNFFKFLFALVLLALPAASQVRDLKITVEPTANSRYKVGLAFQGDTDGTTKIILPNEWGGQTQLYKSLSNFAVKGDSSVLSGDADEKTRTITHKADQNIDLAYEIGNGFDGPFRNEIRYRPVVDLNFIHWIGNAVWALPDWDDRTDVEVSIEWKGFPANWKIANSFAAGKRKQRSRMRFGELRQAIFVAGDFRVVETKAGSNPVNVAIRGSWQFKDTELAEMISKVIEVQRDFWNDHSQKYYLVTLISLDEGPDSISLGGTGLTDSFALFATPNASIDKLRTLIVHEYSHNWIPGKLGKMPVKDERSLYWFSEGFTEFYTYELLRRGKIISEQEYVDRYNELIREYYQLPVREAPNERIVKDFWSDRDVQRLPYLRGFLFATEMNAAIKRASGGEHSLDSVIHDMFKAALDSQQELSFESLAATFSKYLGEDAMPPMTRHLIRGELITPAADALGEGITRSIAAIPIFELGFDINRFAKDGIVAGVVPSSSAYAAGLRNGQQRNGGFSFFFGDTSKEIELQVKDDEGEKAIKFLPVAGERRMVPQFKRDQ